MVKSQGEDIVKRRRTERGEDGGGIYKEERGGGRGAVRTHALFPPALGPTTARETERKKACEVATALVCTLSQNGYGDECVALPFIMRQDG